MRSNLKLVVNNPLKKIEEKQFFEKDELKIILDLYAKMVSEGSWKDYGLSISKKTVSFNVYQRTSEFPVYKITKNLKPKNKNEKYILDPKIHFWMFFFEFCFSNTILDRFLMLETLKIAISPRREHDFYKTDVCKKTQKN